MGPTRGEGQEAEAENASALPLRAINALVRLGGILSALLILVAIGLVSYAVIQRYVFRSPLLWADEVIGYGLVAMVMLGAAEAYRRGDHISIDLVTANAGPRLSRGLAIWADLSVLAVAAVIGLSTWEAITFAYAFGSYSSGVIEIATWIPQIPILIAAVLLGLTAVKRVIRYFVGDGRP